METSILSLITIFDVTSTVLASITAYLYSCLPDVQNSHGMCVFHFSSNMALMHAVLFLRVSKIASKISNFITKFCVIEAYAFVYIIAAVNTWSVILSYNTWKEVKQILIINRIYPTRRLNCYRFLGYGVPILYVALIMFFTTSHIFSNPPFRQFCYDEMEYSIALSSLGNIFLNVFYFVDSQRRLWNLFTEITEAQNENPLHRSSFTALKYKMHLTKLCLTMNIPFGLISTIIFVAVKCMGGTHNSSVELLSSINIFLASLQGTFIFLVAVVLRKLAIKSFITHHHKSCLGCIRIPKCLMRLSANSDVEENHDTS